jgi:hypothetical protein
VGRLGMSAAAQLAFTDPLEARILPRSGRPFWTLNVKVPGGRMSQHPHRLSDMDWILRNVNPNIDTYMSQGFFDAPCRRAMHLAWLTHGFVDLDIYRLPVPPEPRLAAFWVREHCHDNNIPAPSLIIFSGRGIYLKWMWSSPIPRAAAGRAVAVNRALVRAFAARGADPACVDVSRILRVVGTVNSKSGAPAEILWQEERDGQILTYDFERFANEVLPHTMEEIRSFREGAAQARMHILAQERSKRRSQQRVPGKKFAVEDWHWGVVEDIRTIVERRWNGTAPEGHRDIVGHLAACQLARVIPAGQLWHEIVALGRLILPSNYVNGPEFRQHCSTLLNNARRAARGEKTEFEGKAYPPVYTYRRDTLIERLEITPAEMPLMTRLIDKAEHDRRRVEARRAKGVIPRTEYEAAAAERSAEARAMLMECGSIKAVAERLGISYEATKKRLQRA